MHAVYVLGGPEHGRRIEFINKLKEDCKKAWMEAPEEHSLYAQNTPLPVLMDLLLNGSLFSRGKLVFYFGADQIKAKSDIQNLVAYIRNPAESTVLVLVSDSTGIDKTIESAMPKEAKKVFWELSAAEMEAWIRDFFKSRNIAIQPAAVSSLLDLVENNTEAMKTECSRLALFFPASSSINEEAVESYIVHNRIEDVFSLFDKMATGSLEQALSCLTAILANRESSAVAIISGLLWSFRRLLTIHRTMIKGIGYEEAARAERITRRSTLASYHLARLKWNRDVCNDLIAFGVDIDTKLRSMGQSFEQALLELFVYSCMVKKGSMRLGQL